MFQETHTGLQLGQLNGTLDEDAAQLIVVLNDRDTALMLKLALT